MGDISDINSAQSIKVIGSDATGVEQTPVNSSSEGELYASDITRTTGLDNTITITAGSVVELKVGGAAKANRKYVQIQAKANGLQWGFSLTTQSFNAFRDQFFILPFGAATTIYLKNTSGSNIQVAIAEV